MANRKSISSAVSAAAVRLIAGICTSSARSASLSTGTVAASELIRSPGASNQLVSIVAYTIAHRVRYAQFGLHLQQPTDAAVPSASASAEPSISAAGTAATISAPSRRSSTATTTETTRTGSH